ncbi:MAG: hypothetical protein ACJAS3_001788 [Roseivirga sp.]
MLKFFRKNDPFLLLFIAAFVVISRAAILIIGVDTVDIHIQALAFGKAFNLQPEILAFNNLSAGPLFSFFYGLLTLLVEDTFYVSLVLAAVLVFIQALIFNAIIQRNAAFQENNFLPGFLFALFTTAHVDFLFLSPVLIANTFLLLAMDKILTHLKYRGSEENILSTGFLIGLAALCYTSYFWLLLLCIIVYSFYSSTLVRRYFLMTYGFIFSFVLFWIYYLAMEEGQLFFNAYFGMAFDTTLLNIESLNEVMLVLGIPILCSLFSAAQGFQGLGFTNHQVLIQRTMLWIFVFSIFMFWLSPAFYELNAMTIIIPLTFFSSQFLITRNKSWVAESLFWLLVLTSISIQYLV